MAAWNPAQEAPKEEPESAPCAETEPDAPEAAEQETVLAEPEQMNFDPTADQPEPLRYVGEVFRTYILAERGDELCLIDKHAAHERQLYEKSSRELWQCAQPDAAGACCHRPCCGGKAGPAG